MTAKQPRHGRGHYADVAFPNKPTTTKSTAVDLATKDKPSAICSVCGLRVNTRVANKNWRDQSAWLFGARTNVTVYWNHRVGTKKQGGSWPCPGSGTEVLNTETILTPSK